MPRWLLLAVVICLFQLLLFVLLRSYIWLSGHKPRWYAVVLLFGLGNSLFGARWFLPHGIIVFANVLALSWLWFLVALPIGLLHLLGHGRHDKYLKPLLPTAFLALLGFAWFSAHSPTILRYQIQLNKPLAPLKIALVTDTHFGLWVGKGMAEKLVAMLNAEQVDMVLMPGDIINDNPDYYDRDGIAQILKRIQAPVYATLGNHEFYGDTAGNDRALREAGMHVLRDETAIFNNQIAIIGRDDDHARARPSLPELLAQVDQQMPVFVLDHRPTNIEEAATLPIDMQVSGHSHRGQIFPANFITSSMYVLDHGHAEIGGVHFFTSSGFGYWGTPLRLGSRSELMIIEVSGKE